MNINIIADKVEISLISIQNDFDNYQKSFFPERSREFFCLELNGEAGELANAEKKRWKGRKVQEETFIDEVADVFIALMNYSNSCNINIGKAVAAKLKKIEEIRLKLAEEGREY